MEKSPESDSLIMSGEVSRADIAALVCDILLLGIFLYNQIFYGLDMWFLILPLMAIGIYWVVFGIFPEKYHFTETSLEVRHLYCEVAAIPYEAVFDLEMTSRDGFVNLLQENKVKVYYAAGKAKKMTVCRPGNVHAFQDELRKRCPEIRKDSKNTKLDVFIQK